MSKDLLFSVTAKDFDVQFFRGSGAGGQHRNKTSNACRCTHPASGAVGTCQEGRSQSQNRATAFRRCIETKEFKNWHRLEIAARLKGYADADRMVDKQMEEENLKVEYYTP